jgi:hypothetical protein
MVIGSSFAWAGGCVIVLAGHDNASTEILASRLVQSGRAAWRLRLRGMPRILA